VAGATDEGSVGCAASSATSVAGAVSAGWSGNGCVASTPVDPRATGPGSAGPEIFGSTVRVNSPERLPDPIMRNATKAAAKQHASNTITAVIRMAGGMPLRVAGKGAVWLPDGDPTTPGAANGGGAASPPRTGAGADDDGMAGGPAGIARAGAVGWGSTARAWAIVSASTVTRPPDTGGRALDDTAGSGTGSGPSSTTGTAGDTGNGGGGGGADATGGAAVVIGSVAPPMPLDTSGAKIVSSDSVSDVAPDGETGGGTCGRTGAGTGGTTGDEAGGTAGLAGAAAAGWVRSLARCARARSSWAAVADGSDGGRGVGTTVGGGVSAAGIDGTATTTVASSALACRARRRARARSLRNAWRSA
jgi:hypothetical protein